MKRIVDDIIYDTDNARLIDMVWFRCEYNEALYCANWFGNPYFLYIYVKVDDEPQPYRFEHIIPISLQEAQEWAKKWLDEEDYYQEFGEEMGTDDKEI